LDKIRLAKKIAESGIASRREAERLIEDGRVIVDGEVVRTPVFFVTDQSKILVDGKSVSQKAEEIIIWKFHKPKGVITTKRDPGNRKTVFDFFPDVNQRLLYVGRLDYNSEGLLLFTNNGDVARKLELPATALKRTYRARIFGKLTEENIQKLKRGVTIDGIKYGTVFLEVDRSSAPQANSWVTISIHEGKNREVRKILEYVGCTVNRLIRISYGPFNLGNMPPEKISLASKREMADLMKILALSPKVDEK